MTRISFDIGGVLSKYPTIFLPMVKALIAGGAEVHVITDMHDREKTLNTLAMNGFDCIPPERVHNANYAEHGELCKAVLLKRLGIDVHLDDFPGYLAEGCPVRLQVLPDPREPYYHDEWKTDGSEGNFGRRPKGTP
jgi:hypothetical protein